MIKKVAFNCQFCQHEFVRYIGRTGTGKLKLLIAVDPDRWVWPRDHRCPECGTKVSRRKAHVPRQTKHFVCYECAGPVDSAQHFTIRLQHKKTDKTILRHICSVSCAHVYIARNLSNIHTLRRFLDLTAVYPDD